MCPYKVRIHSFFYNLKVKFIDRNGNMKKITTVPEKKFILRHTHIMTTCSVKFPSFTLIYEMKLFKDKHKS